MKELALPVTELRLNDLVFFQEEKKPYRVKAVSERYVICTKPFNPRHTVQYCIIDWQRNVRGPDNLVFGFGYETPEQIAHEMKMLLDGTMEVSHRRDAPLHIIKVKR